MVGQSKTAPGTDLASKTSGCSPYLVRSSGTCRSGILKADISDHQAHRDSSLQKETYRRH